MVWKVNYRRWIWEGDLKSKFLWTSWKGGRGGPLGLFFFLFSFSQPPAPGQYPLWNSTMMAVIQDQDTKGPRQPVPQAQGQSPSLWLPVSVLWPTVPHTDTQQGTQPLALLWRNREGRPLDSAGKTVERTEGKTVACWSGTWPGLSVEWAWGDGSWAASHGLQELSSRKAPTGWPKEDCRLRNQKCSLVQRRHPRAVVQTTHQNKNTHVPFSMQAGPQHLTALHVKGLQPKAITTQQRKNPGKS